MLSYIVRQGQVQDIYQTMDSKKNTPYLILMDEVWSAFHGYFEVKKNYHITKRFDCIFMFYCNYSTKG